MNKTLNHSFSIMKHEYPHVLEFGVYRGRTLSQIRKALPVEKFKVFGFDSFVGLPEDWTGTNLKKGHFSTRKSIPQIEGVKFHVGWFKDTIPEYQKDAQDISLLHIDCDLYSSTIDILYGLHPWIKEGTIIVFDEWFYNHKDIEENRQHEQKAFFEWAADKNVSYEIFPEIEDERRIIKIL